MQVSATTAMPSLYGTGRAHKAQAGFDLAVSPFATAVSYRQSGALRETAASAGATDIHALYEQAASETAAIRGELTSRDQLLLLLLMNGHEDRLEDFDPDAPGGAELTEEMLEALRGRYDPDSMTAEEFRSLLLDLVDLGVLSARDALGTGIMTADSDRVSGYLVEVGSEQELERNRLLQALADSYLKDWIYKADREPETSKDSGTQALVESHRRVREALTAIFPDAPETVLF